MPLGPLRCSVKSKGSSSSTTTTTTMTGIPDNPVKNCIPHSTLTFAAQQVNSLSFAIEIAVGYIRLSTVVVAAGSAAAAAVGRSLRFG